MAYKEETQRALSDLEILKKIILNKEKQNQISIASSSTHKILHFIALFFASIFILMDLPSIDLLTTDVIKSASDPILQRMGVINIGIVLLLFIVGAYYVLYKQALKNQHDFSKYVSRYFIYFKNLSFCTDVLVKYAFFSVLVFTGKPEWIAPALLLFLGDWVANGRFFIFKVQMSIAIAIACIALAAILFIMSIYWLWIPLAVFIAVAVLSLYEIIKFESYAKNNSVGIQ